MGSHIDPRLYGPAQQPHFDSNGPRLPPIHHPQQPQEVPGATTASSLPHYSGPYYGQAGPIPQPSAHMPQSPPTDHAPPRHDAPPPASSPSNDGQAEAQDPKRSRACEACRGLKVKCDQDNPDQPCKRCAKAKRPCIVTAPNRRRQKKTDSRVAELEKKIDALTASLQAKEGVATDGVHRRDDPNQGSYASQSFGTPASDRGYAGTGRTSEPSSVNKLAHMGGYAAGVKRSHDEYAQDSPKKEFSRPGTAVAYETVEYDQIDAQIDQVLDRRDAAKVFDYYLSEMTPHFPAVTFPLGTKADDVRENKPILFLAILVVASVGLIDKQTGQHLARLCLGVLADSIIRNGDKSLELTQALMVSTIWYRPPSRYEQMNFYQLTHIAAVMAIELGIGKPVPQALRGSTRLEKGQFHKASIRADQIEARRTWLGCYFLCANVAMTLRRPNLLRWSRYMDECINILENSPDALASDKVFCQHVKLQHLNEEVGFQFQMEDSSAQVEFSNPSTKQALVELEGRLKSWSNSVPNSVYTLALHYNEQVTNLYMHEIAMHINHNVDDYRSPFTEESLKAASALSSVLSPDHSSALEECLKAVHACFEDFFKFDMGTVRALPIFYFIRIAYAVVCLIKLSFAVTAPGSEVGKIIPKEVLNVEHLLNKLLSIFHTVEDVDSFRPATRFLFILERCSQWFHTHKHSQDPSTSDRTKLNHQESHYQQTAQDALDSAAANQRRNRSDTSSESMHDPNKRPRYSGGPQPSPLETLSDVAASQSDPRRLSNSLPPPSSYSAPNNQAYPAPQQHQSPSPYPQQRQDPTAPFYPPPTMGGMPAGALIAPGSHMFAHAGGEYGTNVFAFDHAFGMALGSDEFAMAGMGVGGDAADGAAGAGGADYRGW